MIIVFCGKCLPEKVVLGCENRRGDVSEVHDEHPSICQTLFFGMSYREWQSVEVKDDPAATNAAIVDKFGDRFVWPKKGTEPAK